MMFRSSIAAVAVLLLSGICQGTEASGETLARLADQLIAAVRGGDAKAQRETFHKEAWRQPLVVGRRFASGRKTSFFMVQASGQLERAERIGFRPGIVYSRDRSRAVVGLRGSDTQRNIRSIYLLAARLDKVWKFSGACLDSDGALAYLVGVLPEKLDEEPVKLVEAMNRAMTQKKPKAAEALYTEMAWKQWGGGNDLYQRAYVKLELQILGAHRRVARPGADEPPGWALVVVGIRKRDNREILRVHMLAVKMGEGMRITLVTRQDGPVADFLAGHFLPEKDVSKLPSSKEIDALAHKMVDRINKGDMRSARELFLSRDAQWDSFSTIRDNIDNGLDPAVGANRVNARFGKAVFTIEWKSADPRRPPPLPKPVTVRCQKTPKGWRIVGSARGDPGGNRWLATRATTARATPRREGGSGTE